MTINAKSSATSTGPKRKAVRAEVKGLNRLCEECGIKTPARFLLVTLYSYANREGWCYPSHALIAKDTGLAERTIRYALNDLEEAGLIRTAKPAKASNGAKGYFTLGGKKTPRGQSLYLVWPVASASGRADYAQLKGLRPREGEDLKKVSWYLHVNERHGPFSYEEVVRLIREDSIKPSTLVQNGHDGDLFSAVDVPIFAPEFKLARTA